MNDKVDAMVVEEEVVGVEELDMTAEEEQDSDTALNRLWKQIDAERAAAKEVEDAKAAQKAV